MASFLRARAPLRQNPSSLFLRLPSTYRSFHASPRPQSLDLQTLLSSTHGILNLIHSSTSLPWALTLPLSALLMRVTIMLPISIYTRRKLQKSAELNPVIYAWGHHFRGSIMKSDRGATPGYVEKRVAEAIRAKQREIYKRWGAQRWKQFLPPMVQVPVWLTLVETIRAMCGTQKGLLGLMIPDSLQATVSNASESVGIDISSSNLTLVQGSQGSNTVFSGADIGFEPGLATEGILWFPNLLLPDPLLVPVLPILLSGAMILNITTPYHKRNISRSKVGQRLHRGAIVVALVVAPLTMQMPAAILTYWISSATFGFMQNYLLDRFMPYKEPAKPCGSEGKPLDQQQVAALLSQLNLPVPPLKIK